MPLLINKDTGLAEDLPQDLADKALAGQTHEIPLFDPEGNFGSAPLQDAQKLISAGHRQLSDDELQEMYEKGVYRSTPQQIAAGVEQFGKGLLPFGISTGIERVLGVDPEGIRKREELSLGLPAKIALEGAGLYASQYIPGLGAANIYGKAAGAASRAATSAVTKGVAQSETLAKLGQLAGSAAGLGTEFGMMGAGNEISNIIAQDDISKMILEKPAETMEHAIANVGLSAVLGVATAGLGAGLGYGFNKVSPLWKAASGTKAGNMVRDFVDEFGYLVKNPDLSDTLKTQLQTAHDSLAQGSRLLYETGGLKEQTIKSLLASGRPEEAQKIAQSIYDEGLEKLASLYESNAPQFITKEFRISLQRLADRLGIVTEESKLGQFNRTKAGQVLAQMERPEAQLIKETVEPKVAKVSKKAARENLPLNMTDDDILNGIVEDLSSVSTDPGGYVKGVGVEDGNIIKRIAKSTTGIDYVLSAKNKYGYTKKQIDSLINTLKSNRPLTGKQQFVFEDLIKSYKQKYKIGPRGAELDAAAREYAQNAVDGLQFFEQIPEYEQQIFKQKYSEFIAKNGKKLTPEVEDLAQKSATEAVEKRIAESGAEVSAEERQRLFSEAYDDFVNPYRLGKVSSTAEGPAVEVAAVEAAPSKAAATEAVTPLRAKSPAEIELEAFEYGINKAKEFAQQSKTPLTAEREREIANHYTQEFLTAVRTTRAGEPLVIGTAKLVEDPYHYYDAINKFKQEIAKVSKFEKGTFPSATEKYNINDVRNYWKKIQQNLEDEGAWGQAGQWQKAINKAFSDLRGKGPDSPGPLNRFRANFMTRGTRDYEVDADKIARFYRGVGRGEKEVIQHNLEDFIQGHNNFHDVIRDVSKQLGIERPIEAHALVQAQKATNRLTPGALLAHQYFQKGLGSSIGSAIGALEGHAFGHPFMGAILGSKLLGPLLDQIIPGVAKAVLDKGSAAVSGSGFKAAMEAAYNAVQNTKKMSKSVGGLFDSTVKVTGPILVSEAARNKLDKRIKELAQNPNEMLDHDSELNHYMPNHQAMTTATMQRAIDYINSQRPNPEPQSPLDNKPPVSKDQEAKFQQILSIAQDPDTVFRIMKAGKLTSEMVYAYATIYPSLYKQASDMMWSEMIEKKHKMNSIPYGQKINMSIFLGQPLDSTMQPMAIMTTQSVLGSKKQQAPMPSMIPQASGGTSKMSALAKQPSMYLTPLQSRAMNKSNR